MTLRLAFDRDVSHRRMYLNTRTLVGGAFQGRLGGVALLGKVP